MNNKRGLIIALIALTAVSAYRLVQFGPAEGTVQHAAEGASCLGVTTDVGAAAGQRVDVTLTDIAPVEYGGTVTQGDRLASDAEGRAVAVTGTAKSVGIAMVSGKAGDIGGVLLRG